MSSKPASTIASLSRRRALAVPGAAVLASVIGPGLLAACGGGGSDAGATAAASGYMRGAITGLGSIIVGGIRFDDSAARVLDDDDGTHDRGELKLGMVVDIQSSSIDDSSARGVAAEVRFGSEIKGPIQTIGDQTLTVLDQTIDIKPETVFDPSINGGFAGLQTGQVLEIHALFDGATGHYIATRLELEDNASEYRLRGVISDVTGTTFKIGNALIDYSTAAMGDLPPLADGQRVRVRLATTKSAADAWVALSVRRGVRRPDSVEDGRLRGYIDTFTSTTQFTVNGIPVDASGASVEGTIALGALVEARGRIDNGTLVATRVKAIDRLSDDFRRVELHGTVSNLDASTFVLRDVKVNYASVQEWKNGSPGDLANDKAVEVKGLWSTDRSVLIAAIIEFE